MSRCLYGEPALLAGLVETDALVDDVLVATLEAMVLAALLMDELRQSVGRYAVGDDRASGMFLEYYCCYERYERVAVYRVAVTVHDGGAVHVGVEDYSQVGMASHHRLAYGLHGLLVLRVRDVVGEVSVGFGELASFRVGTQLLEHVDEEAAVAVSGIHDDVKSLERLVIVAGVDLRAYVVHQVCLIACHKVILHALAALLVHGQ